MTTTSAIPAFAREYKRKKDLEQQRANKPQYFEQFRGGRRELYKIQGQKVWCIHKENQDFGGQGKIQVTVDYIENAPEHLTQMIKTNLGYNPVSQQLWNSMLDQVIMHLKSL